MAFSSSEKENGFIILQLSLSTSAEAFIFLYSFAQAVDLPIPLAPQTNISFFMYLPPPNIIYLLSTRNPADRKYKNRKTKAGTAPGCTPGACLLGALPRIPEESLSL
jgi:hypothetical protein